MKITKKWLKTKLKLKMKIITKGCQKVILINIDKDITLLLMAG